MDKEDIDPPSYEHAIQSETPTFRYGKINDASYDSFERGEMFINAFSNQLDTRPEKEIEEIKAYGLNQVQKIDDQRGLPAIFQHPLLPFEIIQPRQIQFWPRWPANTAETDVSVQASHPFLDSGYFEITVQACAPETVLAIGLSTRPYPLFRLPGWNRYSVGYHSDDGHAFCDDATGGRAYGPVWTLYDTIGCGYSQNQAFFTKNGQHLGSAFHSLLPHHYFPTVAADGPALLEINFGHRPFLYSF